MLSSRAAIRRELCELWKWADRNLRPFSKGKWKVIHLGCSNIHDYKAGGWLARKQLCRRAHGHSSVQWTEHEWQVFSGSNKNCINKRGWGMWLYQLQHLWDYFWSAVTSFVSWLSGRCWQNGECSRWSLHCLLRVIRHHFQPKRVCVATSL